MNVRRHGLMVAAVALVAALPVEGQQPPPPEPFLIVMGTGEARIPSDRARLSFMVETQAPTAQAAATQNAERMDRVVRALRTSGGQTVQVETGGYELQPVYRQVPRDESGIPRIDAYRAVNHVHVRADDVARVGALIDAAIAAGANRITGLSFEAKDPQPARLDALRQAVAKARTEADAVAAAMGVALGPPLEVNVSSDYVMPPRPYYDMGARVAMEAVQVAPTPVEPGEQTVRATVNIRYRLGNR
jgi:uncharacterized protein YggE